MRVLVTGASGFVGSAVVKELLSAGHEVLGLVRSEASAQKVKQLGAETLEGDVNDPKILKQGAAACDAVIHTAFNHDFTRYSQSCEDDRKVIEHLGEILSGTAKPVVITSGIGLLRADRPVSEDDKLGSSQNIPRAASEEAANAIAAKGVKSYIVRLPPSTHGKGDYAFVPMVMGMDKEKGKSAYIEDGSNRWPAVHRFDAAKIYRLIIEQQPENRVFHAVAEEGIAFKTIAETISQGLQLPLVSLGQEEAEGHFTWFTYFARMDCRATADITKATLGWKPTHTGLIEDMKEWYFTE